MIGYIYLITDITNGKQYVGQHHYDKEELDPNYHGSGHIIKNIYSKRPETLKEEYIKTCYNQTEMDEWEKYFIFTNNTLYPNGYNLTEGGNGGVLCEESRRKIGEANKGKLAGEKNPMFGKHLIGEKNPMFGKHLSEEIKRKISERAKNISDETRRKMSEAHKGRPAPNKGKPMSEEQKRKLSEAHKGQISPNKGKPMSEEQKKKLSKKVLQFSKTGEFIREWSSFAECERNGFIRSGVRQCCNGKIKSYKGFKWEYEKEVV